jgi:hypothetical protein
MSLMVVVDTNILVYAADATRTLGGAVWIVIARNPGQGE